MEEGTISLVDLDKPVKDFQTFAGLDPTDNLDSETIKLMKTPRCGKEDKAANFVPQHGKWPKKSLTEFRAIQLPGELARMMFIWKQEKHSICGKMYLGRHFMRPHQVQLISK